MRMTSVWGRMRVNKFWSLRQKRDYVSVIQYYLAFPEPGPPPRHKPWKLHPNQYRDEPIEYGPGWVPKNIKWPKERKEDDE